MAERFTKVFSLTPNLYAKGCPIIIEAGALQKDTETGNLIAQLKMKNIGEKIITSCKVTLRAYENNGQEVEGVKEFSYLDLNANPGSEFGSKTPIFLPDTTARSFAVTVEEIVCADNSIDSLAHSEWKQIPEQEIASSILGSSELAKQYEVEAGRSAKYVPQITDGMFLCGCGAVNLKTNSKCYNCGKTYEFLTEHLYNNEQLAKNAELRIAKEQEEKIQEEAKKKKTRTIIIIAAIIAAVLIAGIAVMVNVHKSNTLPFKVGDSYDAATNYMESHASDFDYGYSASTCSGWFDYFGTGDQFSQLVAVSSDYNDEDTIGTIRVDVVDKYQNEVVQKLQKIYDIDPSNLLVDEDKGTITVNDDEVTITIETGYYFNDNADHSNGENVIKITMEGK